jgi:hypothetical protein
MASRLLPYLQATTFHRDYDLSCFLCLYFHLEKSEQTKKEFFNIYTEILNELDESIRKIILYHEKAEIESRFHLYQPPKDWEEM